MSLPPRLGLSVDSLAALRQIRRESQPDPVEAALVAEQAGVDQICVHLREDRRHIQERDVEVLRKVVKTELNLLSSVASEQISLALKLRPDTVTLVPERHEELGTEGGLDLGGQSGPLKNSLNLLREAGLRMVLLVEPGLDAVGAAHKLGAHAVELYGGYYGRCRGFTERSAALAQIRDAAKAAHKLGLGVSVRHGLSYQNIVPVARIPEIIELNVGHAIVSRGAIWGLGAAISQMRELLKTARADTMRAKKEL